jgi:hypothetical protein
LKNGIIKSPQISSTTTNFAFETVVPFSSQDRPDVLPAITTQITQDSNNGFFALVLGRGLRHYTANAQGKYSVAKSIAVTGISGVNPESAFAQAAEGLTKWFRDYYANKPVEVIFRESEANDVFGNLSQIFHAEIFSKAEAQLERANANKILVKSYAAVGIVSGRLSGQGRGTRANTAYNDLLGVYANYPAATSVTVGGDSTDGLAWPTFAHELGHIIRLQTFVPSRGPGTGLPHVADDATAFCIMGDVDGDTDGHEAGLFPCSPHLLRLGHLDATDILTVNVPTDLSRPKEVVLVEHGITSAKAAGDVRVIRVINNGLERMIELRAQPVPVAGDSIWYDAVVRSQFGSMISYHDPKTYPHPDHGLIIHIFQDVPDIIKFDLFEQIPGFNSNIVQPGRKVMIPLNPPGSPKPRGHISNGSFPSNWIILSSVKLTDLGIKIEATQRLSENPKRFKVVLSRL